jgi:phage baseplate assembly protein W
MAQKSYQVLGSDLALTRYIGTASTISLETADSWGTLDLRVVPGGQGGLPLGDVADLAAVSGRENLAQALVLRLLTSVGALAPLGHPAYGCRLIELIGGLNNETTRNLARLFTLEALAAEPRVVEVLELAVRTVAGQPDVIQIAFSVLPLDDDAPLALALEITL